MRLIDLPEIDDTLRPYQVLAKKDIYRAWETCRTVLFQMPTGTGKTRLFSSIIRDIRRQGQAEDVRKRVLVLAHRTELIQQIDETLSFKYGISHGIIKSGVEETWNRTVQVASVQTIVRRLDKWAEKDFSYIIIDEAHHAVSATYLAICKKFPDAKILGVTATPCRLTGDALRKLFRTLVISQPVSKFIEQGYLSPYYYYSIKPDSNTQRQLDSINHFNVEGDYAEADMMRVFDTNKVRANIVAAYQQYAKGKKGIIYTINQAHNKHICEEFEKIGVKIKAIDSKTPTEERKNTVAQFKSGKIDILCNVNIFSEGFDCPDCEFIQLARPTCSLAMYLQQVGRGLRPHPAGIPAVILDNVGSYNKFGLPSANRQWRRHFEGEGQRVTQSNLGASINGVGKPRQINEGDEDMVLIFSGTSLVTQQEAEDGMLLAILNTKEWFPLGFSAILEPFQGIFNVRKFTKAARFYNEYEDIDEWRDSIEDELDTCRMDQENELKADELDWADKHLHEIYKFYYKEKCGLCRILSGSKNLEADIDLFHSGKKKTEDIITLLLPPIYDEINVPDNQDRSICKLEGKYGVISGESLLPIVPFDYERLEFQENGLYLAMKDSKVGLIDGNETVIPFDYDEIEDLKVSETEILYAVSERDHYKLVQFVSGKEKNHQNRLKPSAHLIGDYYIGKCLSHYGYICDSNGYIKHWLGFERIGLRKYKNHDQIVLAIKSVAVTFDKDLNEDGELLHDIPESNKTFMSEYGLSKLFIVGGKGISEFGDASQQVTLEQSKAPVEKKKMTPVKKNYSSNAANDGNVILPNSPYESVTKVSDDRMIVSVAGRKGLIAITSGEERKICEPLFSDLRRNKDHSYTATFDDGGTLVLLEEDLQNITEIIWPYIVYKKESGYYQIKFRTKNVGYFEEVHHLYKNYFAVKNHNQFGIIHCKDNNWTYFRRCECINITLSEDKKNILLFKGGRPRFIPVANLPE